MNDQEQKVVTEIQSTGAFKGISNFISGLKGKTILYIFGGIILIVGIYILISRKTPSDVKITEQNNKKLELVVDSLKASNASLSKKIIDLEATQALYQDQIRKNNDSIDANNKELTKLKKFYNEKINSINSYNTNELDSFFSNRYKNVR